jgi:hypothetical protein
MSSITRKRIWLVSVFTLLFCAALALVFVLSFYKKYSSSVPPTNQETSDNRPLEPFPYASSTGDRATGTAPQTQPGGITANTDITAEIVGRIAERWTMRDLGKTYYASTSERYTIIYSNYFNFFHITIGEEPAKENRSLAEEELLYVLGLPPEQVCDLDVTVSRKTWVTEFQHEGVGLSFCPGSVPLD